MDRSDKHWGVILLEEDRDGKRKICGYKSGHFKDFQLHYHSTFNELIAIKMGILKFEFHLIGHHFLVESDFTTVKGMLNLIKNKMVNAQLLKLAAWFDQFLFDIEHVKGKDNVISNYLSRPSITSIKLRLDPKTHPFHFHTSKVDNTLCIHDGFLISYHFYH